MKKVENFPRLYERSGRYVYRAVIPAHLREVVGYTEFKRTLGTDSLKVAKRAWAEIDAEFERIKSGAERAVSGATHGYQKQLALQNLSMTDVETLVRDWHAFRLNSEFEILRSLARADRTAQLRFEDVREEMKAYAELRHWKWRQSAADVIDHLCEKHNFEMPESGSHVWNRFADRIMEARVDISRRVLARMDDDFSENPAQSDPSFLERAHVQQILNPGSMNAALDEELLLGEQVEKYVEDRGRAVSDATRKANRGRLRLLVAYFGERTDLRSITPQQMEKFRDILLDLPRDPFRALPDTKVADMPKAARERRLKLMDRNNARIIMETASTFVQRLVDRGFLDRSPCIGLAIKKDRRASSRRPPFEIDDLRVLFSAAPYHKETEGMPDFDGTYWVPLIALFSGMRLAEICQLWSDDIIKVDGTPAIRVRNNAERGQELKTLSSERVIPMHRELVRLGLLEWASNFDPDEPNRLFADIPLSKSGSASDVFSKRFAYRMKKLGLDGRGLVFHSFRHTFVDAMRNFGLDDASQKAIGGWTAKDAHSGYGQGPSLERLKQAIDEVRYQDRDGRPLLSSVVCYRKK